MQVWKCVVWVAFTVNQVLWDIENNGLWAVTCVKEHSAAFHSETRGAWIYVIKKVIITLIHITISVLFWL